MCVYDSIFKAVVSGEEIEADHKFKDPFKFRPVSKLIFAMNELPRVEDHSNGFFRRVVVIPFNRTFNEDKRNRNLKYELEQQELDGIFIWALEGLYRLEERGRFVISERLRETNRSV